MSFLVNALRGLTRNIHNNLLKAPAIRTFSSAPNVTQDSEYLPQSPEGTDKTERKNVFDKVNNLIKTADIGRLFAVVHLCGKQFKVTDGDIIIVEGYWPPTNGDKIRLDKVLLAGCKNFTLVGRPILEPGLVDVQATVIEKTLSHTKTHFKKKRRKQYMRINFNRIYQTMVRINSIELKRLVNQPSSQSPSESLRWFSN